MSIGDISRKTDFEKKRFSSGENFVIIGRQCTLKTNFQ